mmetsp:Transcript_100890/g.290057  ORF Transcript_100890/g.290057 Transcript_100890/m.290057 type:complete len:317 (-) Transcript_100890:605-1555(-)
MSSNCWRSPVRRALSCCGSTAGTWPGCKRHGFSTRRRCGTGAALRLRPAWHRRPRPPQLSRPHRLAQFACKSETSPWSPWTADTASALSVGQDTCTRRSTTARRPYRPAVRSTSAAGSFLWTSSSVSATRRGKRSMMSGTCSLMSTTTSPSSGAPIRAGAKMLANTKEGSPVRSVVVAVLCGAGLVGRKPTAPPTARQSTSGTSRIAPSLRTSVGYGRTRRSARSATSPSKKTRAVTTWLAPRLAVADTSSVGCALATGPPTGHRPAGTTSATSTTSRPRRANTSRKRGKWRERSTHLTNTCSSSSDSWTTIAACG